MTTVYFIRHAESPKTDLDERTRGLTDGGQMAAQHVTTYLKVKDKNIDLFFSSPYQRSLLTIEAAARHFGKDILIDEDLRECVFSGRCRKLTSIRSFNRCLSIILFRVTVRKHFVRVSTVEFRH